MMARGHATLAALGGSFVGHFALDLDPLNLVVFSAATAGFGLVPDLDEPKSTISQQFGPLSKPVSGFTRRLAGGHRMATHSWLMLLIMFFVGWAATLSSVVAALVMALSFMLGMRTVLPTSMSHAQDPLIVGSVMVGAVIGYGDAIDPMVLWIAPVLGVLMHQLGDIITPQGVPLLWPSKKNVSITMFRAGSVQETDVAVPLLLIALTITLVLWVGLPSVEWMQTNSVDAFLKDVYEPFLH